MKNQQKRKRGAQLGNQNAIKHGYYSRAFNQKEKYDFSLAAGINGIDEEITLLRFEIKKAVTGGDIKNLVPLSKAAYALEKLIRTRQRVFTDEQAQIGKAVENAFRHILLPLGPEAMRSAVAYHEPQLLKEFDSLNQKNESPARQN
ncbi:MAG: hypothetical protein ABR886_10935 [Dehalococcoidales bacterium]|jgi:hypothetical protein